MKTIILEPATVEAMREYNLRTVGRGVHGPAVIRDQEAIGNLIAKQLPGETLNQTIRRLCASNGEVTKQ